MTLPRILALTFLVLFCCAFVPGLHLDASAGSDTTAYHVFPQGALPTQPSNDGSPVELGVKFRADMNGFITGIRFYKGATDTGIHTGSLWSATGELLATGAFNETGAGWQQLNYSTPVAISANTTYIASYHTGGVFFADFYYFQNQGVDNPPLHALKDGADGGNGVYIYGAGGVFPNQTYSANNYWVDVVFSSGGSATQLITTVSGTPQSASLGTQFAALQAKLTDGSLNPIAGMTVTFTAPSAGASASFSGSNSATATTDTFGVATSPLSTANSIAGTYNVLASVPALTSVAFALSNNTSIAPPATIFAPGTTPTQTFNNGSPVELGVKFRSDVNGSITSVRFYKGPSDAGVHTGSLWSAAGQLLATGPFSGETATGWQQLDFATPVPIAAHTTYTASYHTTGAFFADFYYFRDQGVDNPPLHALKNGVDGGNGVHLYGDGGAFPNQSYSANNYWVDVVFSSGGSATQSITAVSGAPQSALFETGFISPLQARVTDAGGNPIAGVQVKFIAPSDGQPNPRALGPTAIFGDPGSALFEATATTDTLGIATSPSPWPFAFFGTYDVSAVLESAPALTSASFRLTNATTIFAPSTTPTQSFNNGGPVELGVKFRASETGGIVTGIRFYKGPADTGLHTGSLWSSTGQLLATGAFTGETAEGWEQLNFNAPVTITANTTYTASYHTGGAFFADFSYFRDQGVDNTPLHALKDGVDGGNGVYVPGTGGVFPDQSYSASNYWVDVLFAGYRLPIGTGLNTNNPSGCLISLSWTPISGCIKVDPATHVIYGETASYEGSVARRFDPDGSHLCCSRYRDDQYASLKIAALPADNSEGLQFVGVGARISFETGASRSLYATVVYKAGTTQYTALVKVVQGVLSTVASTTGETWHEGDRIEIEAYGSTIRTLHDGVVVLSYVDSLPLSGAPGVVMAGGSPTVAAGSDFVAGNLSLH